MSEAHASDAMRNLVKFMICLAILGIILALGVWYLTSSPAGSHPPLNMM